jgi:negative regulator of flagellin synthesis FlgM
MKIGPLESKPPAASPVERKTGSESPAKPQAPPSTEVALSPAATGLASAGTEATFDARKVEEIAKAIRDGSFTIDAGAIADKLIVNAQELLGRKAG